MIRRMLPMAALCLCVAASAPEASAQQQQDRRDVVMVDVSGSVDGRGYGAERVLPRYRSQLEAFARAAQAHGVDYSIVPFGETAYAPVDKESPETLRPHRGNTNLAGVIDLAESASQGLTPGDVFILTDGLHNTGLAEAGFLDKVRKARDANAGKSHRDGRAVRQHKQLHPARLAHLPR